MGRRGGWQMGKRNVPPSMMKDNFFCPPPPSPRIEHVNVFEPTLNDAFIIKPYSHPPLSALLVCP